MIINQENDDGMMEKSNIKSTEVLRHSTIQIPSENKSKQGENKGKHGENIVSFI